MPFLLRAPSLFPHPGIIGEGNAIVGHIIIIIAKVQLELLAIDLGAALGNHSYRGGGGGRRRRQQAHAEFKSLGPRGHMHFVAVDLVRMKLIAKAGRSPVCRSSPRASKETHYSGKRDLL
jgi:hypothetical protein